MKHFAMVAVALVLLGGSAAFAQEDTKDRDLTSVTVPADFETLKCNGFEVKRPAKWKSQADEGAQLVTSPAEDAAIHCAVVDLPDEALIDNVAKETRKRLGDTVKDLKFQVFAPVKLPMGGKAYFLAYTGKVGDSALKFWQLIAAKGTKCYILSFTAQPAKEKELAPVAEQVFASLKPTPAK